MMDNKWVFFLLGIAFAVFLLPIIQAWFNSRNAGTD